MYSAPCIGDHTCDGVGLSQPYRMTITVTRMSRPMPVAIAATRKRLSAASTFGLTDSSAVVSADAGVWDEVMPSPPSVPADLSRVVLQGSGCTRPARHR